jgi:hypothetical protein
VLGELAVRSNDPGTAAACFRKSLQLAGTKSEHQFLSKRLQSCEAQISA